MFGYFEPVEFLENRSDVVMFWGFSNSTGERRASLVVKRRATLVVKRRATLVVFVMMGRR